MMTKKKKKKESSDLLFDSVVVLFASNLEQQCCVVDFRSKSLARVLLLAMHVPDLWFLSFILSHPKLCLFLRVNHCLHSILS